MTGDSNFMTPTVVFAPVPPNGTHQADYTQLVVHVDARVISATRARRSVNGWLCMDVGDRLLADEPELIISNPICWRVPIHWTSPTKGILAHHICDVLVDAVAGEILEPEKKISEIMLNVNAAALAFRTSVA